MAFLDQHLKCGNLTGGLQSNGALTANFFPAKQGYAVDAILDQAVQNMQIERIEAPAVEAFHLVEIFALYWLPNLGQDRIWPIVEGDSEGQRPLPLNAFEVQVVAIPRP